MQGFTFDAIEANPKMQEEFFSLLKLRIKRKKKAGFQESAELDMELYEAIEEALKKSRKFN